jgi:hypothetical protein
LMYSSCKAKNSFWIIWNSIIIAVLNKSRSFRKQFQDHFNS